MPVEPGFWIPRQSEYMVGALRTFRSDAVVILEPTAIEVAAVLLTKYPSALQPFGW